jgi:hypothetical protein
MDPDVKLAIVRNIVAGLLIVRHVPNFDFGKVFGADFGFSVGTFDAFLDAVKHEIDRQLTPEAWTKVPTFSGDYLDKTVSATVTAISASVH